MEAIDLCGEEGEEVCLPAISTVWECAYINFKDVNGKEGWECQWCGLSFKPRHATRADIFKLVIFFPIEPFSIFI